jgi:hypothetical protein
MSNSLFTAIGPVNDDLNSILSFNPLTSIEGILTHSQTKEVEGETEIQFGVVPTGDVLVVILGPKEVGQRLRRFLGACSSTAYVLTCSASLKASVLRAMPPDSEASWLSV